MVLNSDHLTDVDPGTLNGEMEEQTGLQYSSCPGPEEDEARRSLSLPLSLSLSLSHTHTHSPGNGLGRVGIYRPTLDNLKGPKTRRSSTRRRLTLTDIRAISTIDVNFGKLSKREEVKFGKDILKQNESVSHLTALASQKALIFFEKRDCIIESSHGHH
ncbi:hypothetical protein Dimus_023573 [Dionaea muscipula]